jgi:hypothetical protein
MEAPNTVSGLVRKKAELEKVRDGLEVDLKAITADIDHLDATIRLFGQAKLTSAIGPQMSGHANSTKTTNRLSRRLTA